MRKRGGRLGKVDLDTVRDQDRAINIFSLRFDPVRYHIFSMNDPERDHRACFFEEKLYLLLIGSRSAV